MKVTFVDGDGRLLARGYLFPGVSASDVFRASRGALGVVPDGIEDIPAVALAAGADGVMVAQTGGHPFEDRACGYVESEHGAVPKPQPGRFGGFPDGKGKKAKR